MSKYENAQIGDVILDGGAWQDVTMVVGDRITCTTREKPTKLTDFSDRQIDAMRANTTVTLELGEVEKLILQLAGEYDVMLFAGADGWSVASPGLIKKHTYRIDPDAVIDRTPAENHVDRVVATDAGSDYFLVECGTTLSGIGDSSSYRGTLWRRELPSGDWCEWWVMPGDPSLLYSPPDTKGNCSNDYWTEWGQLDANERMHHPAKPMKVRMAIPDEIGENPA